MTLRRVLVGLTMTEQRYRAVLEVEAGVPVTEVAEWYRRCQRERLMEL